jgi:hypothetical protein
VNRYSDASARLIGTQQQNLKGSGGAKGKEERGRDGEITDE